MEPAGLTRFHDWLAAGYAGGMTYLAGRKEAYSHPRHVLAGVRSLLMLGLPYATRAPVTPLPAGAGRVSRYAWGDVDYHDLIHERIKQLIAALLAWNPAAVARGVVDTAPLLEREFAMLAGLGWIGKNTMLINPRGGSYFFLAALLTDQELDYDAAFTADHCGTCTACLDACPTGAFPQPYSLDATRCISYLTIELRGSIPASLRESAGEWLFGCDVCQQVCPWNRFTSPTDEPSFLPRADQNPVDLMPLFSLTDDDYSQRFRRTPLWRAKRRGLLRNAAIVLGNQGRSEAWPALALGLNDSEQVVRAASAWALGRLPHGDARDSLCTRLQVEQDPEVIAEIRRALAVKA